MLYSAISMRHRSWLHTAHTHIDLDFFFSKFCFRQWLTISLYLRMQDFPSTCRCWPDGHRQIKPPWVFWHWYWHPPPNSWHSSTSKVATIRKLIHGNNASVIFSGYPEYSLTSVKTPLNKHFYKFMWMWNIYIYISLPEMYEEGYHGMIGREMSGCWRPLE